MKKLIILIFILLCCFLASCDLIDTSMFEGAPDVFTVEYDSNGGSEVPPSQAYDGCTVKRPVNPTKEGFVFDGWYTESFEKWSFAADIVEENMTLTANWLPLYEVSFHNPIGIDPESQFVGSGKLASPPDFHADGYYLEGWYDDNNVKWSFESQEVTANTNLTAKLVKMVTVTFDTQDESVPSPKVFVMPGSTIEEFPTVVREGYSFMGWYENVNHSYKLASNEIVFNSDTTIIGRWVKNSSALLVTLDAKDGKLNDNLKRFNCTAGEKLGDLPTPISPAGGTFMGWYDENGVRYTKNTAITESVQLYARYKSYTPCSFNENGIHNFSTWSYNLITPTCTDDKTEERYCLDCQYKDVNIVKDAKGHSFSSRWSYNMLTKTRECFICGNTQTISFNDVTDKVDNVKVEGEIFGEKNLDCLTNGDWEESEKTTFCGKSDGELEVLITLSEITHVEYFYLKGTGGALTYFVSVMYETDTEYTYIGVGAFDNEARKVDVNGRISKIKIYTPQSGEGTVFWQEILLAGY